MKTSRIPADPRSPSNIIRDKNPIRLQRRIIGIVGSCCLADVALLFSFAASLLGPVPFDLIYLLIAASVAGAVLLPACLGPSVGWRTALGCSVAFLALAAFNILCLYAASAAV